MNEVHKLGSIPADEESFRVAYIDKTNDRLKKVKNLVPFANDETIIINGKRCRNVFPKYPRGSIKIGVSPSFNIILLKVQSP